MSHVETGLKTPKLDSFGKNLLNLTKPLTTSDFKVSNQLSEELNNVLSPKIDRRFIEIQEGITELSREIIGRRRAGVDTSKLENELKQLIGRDLRILKTEVRRNLKKPVKSVPTPAEIEWGKYLDEMYPRVTATASRPATASSKEPVTPSTLVKEVKLDMQAFTAEILSPLDKEHKKLVGERLKNYIAGYLNSNKLKVEAGVLTLSSENLALLTQRVGAKLMVDSKMGHYRGFNEFANASGKAAYELFIKSWENSTPLSVVQADAAYGLSQTLNIYGHGLTKEEREKDTWFESRAPYIESALKIVTQVKEYHESLLTANRLDISSKDRLQERLDKLTSQEEKILKAYKKYVLKETEEKSKVKTVTPEPKPVVAATAATAPEPVKVKTTLPPVEPKLTVNKRPVASPRPTPAGPAVPKPVAAASVQTESKPTAKAEKRPDGGLRTLTLPDGSKITVKVLKPSDDGTQVTVMDMDRGRKILTVDASRLEVINSEEKGFWVSVMNGIFKRGGQRVEPKLVSPATTPKAPEKKKGSLRLMRNLAFSSLMLVGVGSAVLFDAKDNVWDVVLGQNIRYQTFNTPSVTAKVEENNGGKQLRWYVKNPTGEGEVELDISNLPSYLPVNINQMVEQTIAKYDPKNVQNSIIKAKLAEYMKSYSNASYVKNDPTLKDYPFPKPEDFRRVPNGQEVKLEREIRIPIPRNSLEYEMIVNGLYFDSNG